ncbi:hypothetical protein H6G95_07680 [Nostoc linckia FACHB-391]|uniref:Uncharacterized protein n=1 Tax=Nostoc linckia FACHB-391 TaxID=2692906 RepID=A0ABR8EV47_NOSLI|nr:hypothetical protein [Nostoc linckia FACHB-391]
MKSRSISNSHQKILLKNYTVTTKATKAQALKKDTSRHNQDPRYTTNKLETRLV